MDDKTEVMFTNLRNDQRIIESEQVEEAVSVTKTAVCVMLTFPCTGIYLLMGPPHHYGIAPTE
jgi:hypothetical protein